ncbi:MAG TPA: glycosyltransferase [Candidatus Bilamarchaeum sp.]|nr:glycosyltransferase [Candidatus Bilamarchaeum sp.]
MKVLHVLGDRGFGGAERMFAETVGALAARGKATNIAFIVNGRRLSRDGRIDAIPEDDCIWAKMGILQKAGRIFDAPLAIFGTVLSERPDVIYAYDPPLDVLICAAAGKLLGSRVAVRCSSRPGSLPRTSRLIMRAAFALCDYAVALSSESRSELERMGVPRIALIPNGKPIPESGSREAARKALSIGDDELAVGVVARLAPNKRQELAVSALSGAPGTRLFLFGHEESPGYAKRLRRIADARGLGERVVFAGFRRDMAAILPGLDALLHTSASEGCPGAVIEGMASGLPVVAVSEPAVREVLGDAGIIVDASPESIAGALNMLKDRPLAAMLGKGARLRAKKFGMDAMADAYEELFSALAGRK